MTITQIHGRLVFVVVHYDTKIVNHFKPKKGHYMIHAPGYYGTSQHYTPSLYSWEKYTPFYIISVFSLIRFKTRITFTLKLKKEFVQINSLTISVSAIKNSSNSRSSHFVRLLDRTCKQNHKKKEECHWYRQISGVIVHRMRQHISMTVRVLTEIGHVSKMLSFPTLTLFIPLSLYNYWLKKKV